MNLEIDNGRRGNRSCIPALRAMALAGTCALMTLPALSDPPPIEARRYEDHYTFKHGATYVLDPYVWGYTKEFAERFRMPEQWIEPDLKGALAVAFRMTTIGNTTCGLGGKADNCWKPLDCQMDIYYDNRIELPWNYPEIIRDNVMQGLSSSQYLHFTPDSRVRKYVAKDPNKPSGIMNAGGSLKHDGEKRVGAGGGSILYYDREYEPGVGLIGFVGIGVCPRYEGPYQVFMDFQDKEDVRRWASFQLPAKDIRIVHRIDFPKTFLARARAVYSEGNKPNEATMDRLINQFIDSRRKAGQSPASQ